MRAPLRCIECERMSLELDLSADHQHLTCQHCGTLYCAICIHRTHASVHQAEVSRRMAKADLN